MWDVLHAIIANCVRVFHAFASDDDDDDDDDDEEEEEEEPGAQGSIEPNPA